MIPSVVNVKDVTSTGPDHVYIGRGSKWGNPFVIGIDGDRDAVIEAYRSHLVESGLIDDIDELEGKVLVCYCKPLRCHGDVLVETFIERALHK